MNKDNLVPSDKNKVGNTSSVLRKHVYTLQSEMQNSKLQARNCR